MLLTELKGHAFWLTLDRPKAFNALSEELLEAVIDAVAATPAGARAIVLAASGSAFCAGHDLKQMRAEPSLGYYEMLFKLCGRMMTALRSAPLPVIARVHGLATAAGCQLVACCDLAVAADSARFATSGVNYGLFCSTPAVNLSRNVPTKPAFEMLVTGQFIDAAEAKRLGLVNHVVSAERLDARIDELVHSIASKPRATIALGKALFYKQQEMGHAAALQLAASTMAHNMMQPAALEGVQAFIDKREPRFEDN